jgi:hypothetical protein
MEQKIRGRFLAASWVKAFERGGLIGISQRLTIYVSPRSRRALVAYRQKPRTLNHPRTGHGAVGFPVPPTRELHPAKFGSRATKGSKRAFLRWEILCLERAPAPRCAARAQLAPPVGTQASTNSCGTKEGSDLRVRINASIGLPACSRPVAVRSATRIHPHKHASCPVTLR